MLPSETLKDVNWWKGIVFYEIFVRSFYDSDGDGIGDLRGLIQKLDYLNDGDPNTQNDLGITGIWLMPITQSTQYHGYDVVDYYSIDDEYGTMKDFKTLITEAHKRGIHVVIDLVINHTSSSHPWFVDASKGEGSRYHNWYIWAKSDSDIIDRKGWPSWYPMGSATIIKEYFAKAKTDSVPALSRQEQMKELGQRISALKTEKYYAFFGPFMPDLNYLNEEVTQEVYKISRYWLDDIGVDGFRLDAIQHLIEENGKLAGTPGTHVWLKKFNHYIHEDAPTALTIGEVWSNTHEVSTYIQNNELDLAFEFSLSQDIVTAINKNDAKILIDRLDSVITSYPSGRFATFLSNHDQIRVIDQFAGDQTKAKLAAAIMLTLPGVPNIFYGEEIGLKGQKPDEKVRAPMQWSAERNAGFSSGQPWQMINQSYETINVFNQMADKESLLNYYKQLIHLRNENKVLRSGEIALAKSDSPDVLAYLRYSPAKNQPLIFVALNFSKQEKQNCVFSLSSTAGVPAGSYYPPNRTLDFNPVSLTIDSRGSFENYIPLKSITPMTAYILTLKPKN